MLDSLTTCLTKFTSSGNRLNLLSQNGKSIMLLIEDNCSSLNFFSIAFPLAEFKITQGLIYPSLISNTDLLRLTYKK